MLGQQQERQQYPEFGAFAVACALDLRFGKLVIPPKMIASTSSTNLFKAFFAAAPKGIASIAELADVAGRVDWLFLSLGYDS